MTSFADTAPLSTGQEPSICRTVRPTCPRGPDEGRDLHATSSRSGKRLIVTVRKGEQWAQVELRPDQVGELPGFVGRER
jgi:hypothetical protein